ncbi:ATP-binding protein [Raineyella fluvialis]|uniref:AAA family ATPase n=1 Tax=Raineyella fluvialis TaxID=2662261 RepID=A0A5Q2FGH5_9ACTN|nr:ATP-binding protein [Raineyella fluvialis]QGF23795.1 AAA family ATPase [Raineyella fluvialis]
MSTTPITVDDEVRQVMAAAFSERRLVELTAAIAAVNLWARFAQGLGVDPAGFGDHCLVDTPLITGSSGDTASVGTGAEGTDPLTTPPTEEREATAGVRGRNDELRVHPPHQRRRVVVTGGPGAGKTALLELVRQTFCSHVVVVQESAGVVFGGGFPRKDTVACRQAGQRAIYYVQRELEAVSDSTAPAVEVCDRGTVDGTAYWPGAAEEYWASLGTTLERELARYDAVIHLRTPRADQGYNRQNPLRIESAEDAAAIDARILTAWAPHPHRHVVAPSAAFLDKVSEAIELLRREIPACCGGALRA